LYGRGQSIKTDLEGKLMSKKEARKMGSHSHEKETIENVLKNSLEIEDLIRTYLITAERVHGDKELKERLQNFAEGNAKRTKQLLDELDK
jgi:hypothetical protein